jgi:hypothetical protein
MTGLDPQLTWLTATTRPFKSSNHPEPEITDRTRQVNADLTPPNVRSSHFFAVCSRGADASVRHWRPDADPARPIAQLASSGKSDRTRRCVKSNVLSILSPLSQSLPPHDSWPDLAACVWSRRGQRLVTVQLLFFFYVRNHFALSSNLLTTKCRTCVHVC